jgi:hypothetical protein
VGIDGSRCSSCRRTSGLLDLLNRSLVEAVPLATAQYAAGQHDAVVVYVATISMAVGVGRRIISSKCWLMNTKDTAGTASEFTRNYGYCSTGLI